MYHNHLYQTILLTRANRLKKIYDNGTLRSKSKTFITSLSAANSSSSVKMKLLCLTSSVGKPWSLSFIKNKPILISNKIKYMFHQLLTSILIDISRALETSNWNLSFATIFFIKYKSISLTAMYNTSWFNP